MEKKYTTREICRGLNIQERSLIHWAEKGLVNPLVDADGFASRRQYSPNNVFEIAIIKALWGKVSTSIIKNALISIKKKLLIELNYDFKEILLNDDIVIILNVKKVHDKILNFLSE